MGVKVYNDDMNINIRALYLYLVTFVGLLITVIGLISMVNLGLRTLVFPEADRWEIFPMVVDAGTPAPSMEDEIIRQDKEVACQRQRDLTNSISMVLIGAPVYLYHWKKIQRDSL